MGLGCDSNDDKLENILNKTFLSEFRTGYMNIKGVTMPARFRDLWPAVENWKVFDNDTWVCSFPKTGTTWAQEMVWLIANDLDFEGAKEGLAERFPFLEVSSLFDYRKLKQDNKEFNPPTQLDDSIKFVLQKQQPRFIKTHLPWTLLPELIQIGTKIPKIVYTARNPKDTCVSYFHHCRLLEGYTGNFEDFCELFIAGKLCFTPYWKHVLNFWERRNQSNILFLKYENMKNDLPAVIRQVAKFLEKDLTEEQIERLRKHLSFDAMKNNNAVNFEAVIDLNKKFKLIEEDGCFMRSGKVGGYKDSMPQTLIEKFDKWTDENLAGTGLNL